jgi:NifU-like protein
VSFYPPKINERFSSPAFAGEAESANAEGVEASFICGSAVRFSLRIDEASKEILTARFRTNGCGYMVAAADVIAEKITGKKLVQLDGLHDEVILGWLEGETGEFPALRRQCASVCISALHKGLAHFRLLQIEEWRGEQALICTCFGVSEETIESCIRTRKLLTVDEVTVECNAGGGCGSCQPLIQDILDSAEREML